MALVADYRSKIKAAVEAPKQALSMAITALAIALLALLVALGKGR